MQPEMMNGTQSQIVGKLTLFIRPDGTLVVQTGNRTARLVASPDEARSLLDYLLRYARFFEEASRNGQAVDTGPLHQLERQSQ